VPELEVLGDGHLTLDYGCRVLAPLSERWRAGLKHVPLSIRDDAGRVALRNITQDAKRRE
jgi:hypothetical protein